MKTMLTMIGLVACLTGATQSTESFIVSPEYPRPGQAVDFSYTPANQGSRSKKLSCVVYAFEDAAQAPVAEDVALTAGEKQYTGTLITSSKAKAVFIKFTSGEENDGVFFAVPMHDAAHQPIRGALVSMAAGYNNYAWLFGSVPEQAKAYDYFNRELSVNPSAKDEYFELYGTLAYLNDDQQALTGIKSSMKKLASKKLVTESELMTLYRMQSLMSGTFDDEVAKTKIKITDLFPEGQLATEALLREFFDECEPANRKGFFRTYHKSIPAEPRSVMALHLAIEAGAYDAKIFEYYISFIMDKLRLAYAYNGAAWRLSGEDLEGTMPDSLRAIAYSQRSLDLIRECLITAEGKPVYVPRSHWISDMRTVYGNFSSTYALIQFKRQQYDDALWHQEIFNAYCTPEIDDHERYAVYVYHVNGAEPALLLMADFIADGLASSRMRNRFSALLATLPPEAVLRLTRVMLENLGLEAFRMELENDKIDKAAPDFSLLNLKGEEVSLDKLRGKVIVIDFWASWCGPCIAGFPDMQEAVTAYKDDETVKFLFVNTWERYARSGKVAKATEFIEKKDYSFNVLVDIDDIMAKDYHIDALPTHLIIGPDGRIKFNRLNHRADERFLDELAIKIELARESAAHDRLSTMLWNDSTKKD
ncbi:MAG: TlpA family protein disulfide reductase [Cyclobacteriaceae bacterium]|nr:TlpA family protein disulfide reductase [Cyclobacteriaceae bacterium]